MVFCFAHRPISANCIMRQDSVFEGTCQTHWTTICVLRHMVKAIDDRFERHHEQLTKHLLDKAESIIAKQYASVTNIGHGSTLFSIMDEAVSR